MSAMAQDDLPPALPGPALAQTLAAFTRLERFDRWVMERYPTVLRMKVLGVGEVVTLRDAEAIRELFTASPGRRHAGAINGRVLPILGRGSVMLLDGEQPPAHAQAPAAAVPRRGDPRLRGADRAHRGRGGRALAPRLRVRASPADAGDRARGDPRGRARGPRRERRRAPARDAAEGPRGEPARVPARGPQPWLADGADRAAAALGARRAARRRRSCARRSPRTARAPAAGTSSRCSSSPATRTGGRLSATPSSSASC